MSDLAPESREEGVQIPGAGTRADEALDGVRGTAPTTRDLVPNTTHHRADCERLCRIYPCRVKLRDFGTKDNPGPKQFLVGTYREESWCDEHNTRTFGFISEDHARDFASRHDGEFSISASAV